MTGKSSRATSARRTASLILIAIGLFIPALSLIPLGSLWLWQHGYLLYWTGFAFAAVMAVYLTQRHLLPPPKALEAASDAPPPPADLDGPTRDLAWSPAEEMAWTEVQALARRTDPERIASTDGLWRLAQDTIATVAQKLHKGRDDPLWQFTTPEALAIIERVSRRLRMIVLDRVPFGDRLTVAQALAIYRWRGAVDVAERAYDVWRIVRLANPATAAANEATVVAWSRSGYEVTVTVQVGEQRATARATDEP